MSEKTKEQLEQELRVRDLLDEERKKSNEAYAIKLVEKIVFVLVGMLAAGVVAAIIRVVLK